MRAKHQEGERQEHLAKEKGNTLGAKLEAPKEDATYVAVSTMQESVHRIQKEVRRKGRTTRIQHRGSGQDGIQDSDRRNGKICAQATPRDGGKGSQKG